MRDNEDEAFVVSSDDNNVDENLPPPPKRFHLDAKNLTRDTVRVSHHSIFMIC